MSLHLLAAESNLSLIILITGFVVVFAVLILLIAIIKLYSVIVSSVQQKFEQKAAAKAAKTVAPATAEAPLAPKAAPAPVAATNGALDLQTVAVITAAAEAYCGDTNVRVTGITPVSSTRSEWATAGVHGNISMRSEGLF